MSKINFPFVYSTLANLIRISLIMFLVFGFSTKAQALEDCTEQKLRDLGVSVVNCSGEEAKTKGCSDSTASDSKSGDISNLYMVGDSITVQTYDSYRSAFSEKNITSYIDAKGGSAWIWGGGTGGSGTTPAPEGRDGSRKDAVRLDSAEIAKANGIIIALGSNGGLDANPIEEIIDTIRSYNQTAQIWWINVARKSGTAADSTHAGTFNTALDAASSSKNFKVIDWLRAISPEAKLSDDLVVDNNGYLADILHPTTKGRTVLKDLVSAAISGGGTGGCLQLEGGDNQAQVFNFFIKNGFTPEQAAGIVGNMIHESGVEPKKYQGYYGGRLFSSSEVTNATAGGTNGTLAKKGDGWGIVQWTPANKIIASSFTAGKTYEEIDTLAYQLQFLLEQLNGTGTGGAISSEKSAGDKLKSTTTVEDAALYFARYYERCAECGSTINPNLQRRIDSSVDILTRYGS